ncbi:MAG: riboflavin biosynthesis protein RibD [Phenylobacterium zucineum]|nr:MAG: riboflavin biosynthesis protein RibD [Phenylobacterium zucineum]
MRRAIELAHIHLGQTAENPSVGCVLIKADLIVGEGVTGVGGRPHAEEVALGQAAEAANGAIAYVTLEPCAHRTTGRMACADRLIAAGITRVVVACADMSVHASGLGVSKLAAAGVVVQTGVLADEAALLYVDYKPA